MKTTVQALKELYAKLGGDLADVALLDRVPDMIEALNSIAVAVPAPTAEDEGKVMTVSEDGALDYADALPPVTAEDAGKVLTVNDQGAWNPAEASGGGGAKSIIPVYVYGSQEYLTAKAEEVIAAYRDNALAGIKVSGNTGFVRSYVIHSADATDGFWYDFFTAAPADDELTTTKYVVAGLVVRNNEADWEFYDVPNYQTEGIDTKAVAIEDFRIYEDSSGVEPIFVHQEGEEGGYFYKFTNEQLDPDNFMKTYDLSGFKHFDQGDFIPRDTDAEYLCVVTTDLLGTIMRVGVAGLANNV